MAIKHRKNTTYITCRPLRNFAKIFIRLKQKVANSMSHTPRDNWLPGIISKNSRTHYYYRSSLSGHTVEKHGSQFLFAPGFPCIVQHIEKLVLLACNSFIGYRKFYYHIKKPVALIGSRICIKVIHTFSKVVHIFIRVQCTQYLHFIIEAQRKWKCLGKVCDIRQWANPLFVRCSFVHSATLRSGQAWQKLFFYFFI